MVDQEPTTPPSDDDKPKYVDEWRTYPFTVERSEVRFAGDGLTFEGYAAVWGATARISNWEGDFYERIQPGAFANSIKQRMPVLQFDHGSHPLVGSMPLGNITQIREDDRGLFVRARLADNWLVKPVRDAIEAGAIDGMSFRFQVIRDEWEQTTPIPTRTLLEVRAPELGPVVFPAYVETTAAVRSVEARRLISMIRHADEATRRDLAALLTFPPNADDVTLGGDPDTPTVRHLSEARARRIEQRVNRLRRLTNDYRGTESQGSGDR